MTRSVKTVAPLPELDANTVVFEPTGEPDDLGRRQFVMYWHGYHTVTGWGTRAQAFYADMPDRIERARAGGKTVIQRNTF